MKKYLSAILVAVCIAAPVYADEFTIDPSHTYPVFEVTHLGFSTQRGRFNKISGKIVLDMAAKQGSVELVIDASSVDMGTPLWDQHVLGEGFLDAEKFPTITFKSNNLIFDGDKVVAAEGLFTLLGVTKPIRLIVSNFKCGVHPFFKKDMCGGDISVTIKRSDFGMNKGIPAVGDEVKIYSPVEAQKI